MLQHLLCAEPQAIESAEQVDRDNLLEVRLGMNLARFGKCPPWHCAASTVDHTVQSTKLIHGCLHSSFHHCFIRNVTLDSKSTVSQLIHDPLCALEVEVRHNDIGALFVKAKDGCLSESGGASSNENGRALQTNHVFDLFRLFERAAESF